MTGETGLRKGGSGWTFDICYVVRNQVHDREDFSHGNSLIKEDESHVKYVRTRYRYLILRNV